MDLRAGGCWPFFVGGCGPKNERLVVWFGPPVKVRVFGLVFVGFYCGFVVFGSAGGVDGCGGGVWRAGWRLGRTGWVAAGLALGMGGLGQAGRVGMHPRGGLPPVS